MDIQELLSTLKSIHEGKTDEWTDLGNLLATKDSFNSLSSTVDQYFYIAIGVATAALVLALIALIVSMVKTNNLKRQVNYLLDAKQKAERQQSFLNGEIQALQRNIVELQNKTQALGEKQTSLAEAGAKIKKVDFAKDISQPVKHEPTDEELYRDFVNAYNNLRQEGAIGLGAKEERNKFFQQYDVKGIACVNYAQRRLNPDISPQLQVADLKNAHYLALSLNNGHLAVVPMLKDYEEQYHYAVGARSVFNSNFQSGSYHKVKVKKPAIFTAIDSLVSKGELILEK